MRGCFQTVKIPFVAALLCLATINVEAQFWDIPLPKPGVVEGTVVDAETGLPLANVTVIAPWPQQWPVPPPNGPLLFPVVLTDADGKFVRNNVYGSDDRAGANFVKDGYSIVQDGGWAMRPGERITGVVVRMKRRQAGIISGRILDNKGNPAVNVSVMLYGAGGISNYSSFPRWSTDDRGEYRLSDVAVGRYWIGFSAPRSILQGGRPYGVSPELIDALPVLLVLALVLVFLPYCGMVVEAN